MDRRNTFFVWVKLMIANAEGGPSLFFGKLSRRQRAGSACAWRESEWTFEERIGEFIFKAKKMYCVQLFYSDRKSSGFKWLDWTIHFKTVTIKRDAFCTLSSLAFGNAHDWLFIPASVSRYNLGPYICIFLAKPKNADYGAQIISEKLTQEICHFIPD